MFVLHAVALSVLFAANAATLEGYWEGAITSKGEKCPTLMEFWREDGQWKGHFSSPDYGYKHWPFDSIRVEGDRVVLEYGGRHKYRYEGEIKGRGADAVFEGEYRSYQFTAPFAVRRVQKPDLPYTVEEVTFNNGDVTLAGAVFAPKSPGKHGAVVILHGSGDNPRWVYFHSAEWFALHDMVCLVFDKRGNGGSSGKWLDVGFEELADDGIAGLRMLQQRPDVDPKRIGFYGISQAGWIMELAAQRCPDTAFFISISGGTAKVEREGYWDYECLLRAKGFSETDVADAIDMLRRYNAVIRSGEGYQEFLEWMQPMREKPWFSTLEWVPRPPDAIFQRWYRRVMDFDPEPILRGLRIPMLFIFGEADDSNPTAEGVAMLERVKTETGKDITVQVFAGADHGVRVPAAKDAAFPFRQQPKEFWSVQENWLREKGFR